MESLTKDAIEEQEAIVPCTQEESRKVTLNEEEEDVLEDKHELSSAQYEIQDKVRQLHEDDVWLATNTFGSDHVLNSTRLNDAVALAGIELSPVRSLRSRLEALKQKAIQTIPEPTNLQERYQLRDIRFKLTHQESDERDKSSVGRLREKYVLFSQLQREEDARRGPQFKTQLDALDQSNSKLTSLKKSLKVKMVQKRREEHEKRVQMYKADNEEDAYEEADGEDEENEEDYEEEEEQQQGEDDDDDDILNTEPKSPERELGEKETLKEDELDDDDHSISVGNMTLDQSDSPPVTQNIILSPQTSVPFKSCLNSFVAEDGKCNKIEQLVSDCKSQSTSQDIMDLCSGKLKSSMALLTYSEDEQDDHSAANDVGDDKPREKSKQEDKFVRKSRFNFDDSDDDLDDFAFKLNQKLKNKQNLIDDDEEDEEESQKSTAKTTTEVIEDEDEEEEEEDEDGDTHERLEVLKKAKLRAKDFIEDQAELSEEDAEAVSSDEEEGGDDEYEQEVINEDLPSDEEILAQNNKMFW
jgi:hypothetical protein